MLRLLSLIFVLAILLPVFYVGYMLAPRSFSSDQVKFVVPLDTNQETILSQLSDQGFIRSKDFFQFILGLRKSPGTIEPGGYMIAHNMDMFTLADTLLNKPFQRWIVLVPGLRKEQVADRLAKKLNWDETRKNEYLSAAQEGYQFPDTYLLNVDYTGKEVAQRILNNFNEKFDADLQRNLLAQNVRNDTAIKIASLIERESGSDEDKALIAGIIWNRLNKKMKLQVDATVQYGLGTEENWWPRVKVADYKLDHPYNTYIISALPPGPIANPSLASIKAAVYPADTECFFYLHEPTKKIHCAETYEEHLENIEKYL